MMDKDRLEATRIMATEGLKDPRMPELATEMANTFTNLVMNADFSPAAMMVAIGVAVQMTRQVTSQNGKPFSIDLIMGGIALGMNQPVVAIDDAGVMPTDLSELPEALREQLKGKLDQLPEAIRDRVGAALGIHPDAGEVH